MGKNLLVLGMSTLPIRRDNEEIISNKCCWESLSEKAGSLGECRKEIEYYSQLEPVSKMIMEREKKSEQNYYLCDSGDTEKSQIQISGAGEKRKCCRFLSFKNRRGNARSGVID